MANKFIFALMAISISFSVALGQSCGQSPQMRPNRRYDPDGQRIVGGVEARPGSHPWIVSLQSGGSHSCGGTLIRVGNQEQTDIVVTAAHCVDDSTPDQVVAGAHDHSRPSKNVQRVSVAKAVPHPNYTISITNNDIAILKLSKPIKFNTNVQPACLPVADEAVPDTAQGMVAGWGLTEDGGSDSSNILMQVGIPVIGSAACTKTYKNKKVTIIPTTMLCGGYSQGGKDTCQMDSGGPYVFKGPNGYTLQGVVSFGVGCAQPNSPGVYARVSNYIPWINQQIKALSKA